MPEPALLRRVLARQFSSLSQYNYRVFFIGQLLSQVGTWMQTVGQAWLVLQLTGSATALGTVTMLQFLPFTLLSLVGGVLADRLPKRQTLIIIQSLATVQALGLAVLALGGWVELWHIYLFAPCLGILSAIERPTRQSFFSELVGKEHLVNAVALNSTLLNTARILGPSLAGVVIALFPVGVTFLVNGISFVAVLIGYALMRPALYFPTSRKPRTANIASEIGEGLRYAVRTPDVLFILILVAFLGTFGYNFNVVVPLVAKFVLHAGPQKFGILTSALGAGAMISAFAIAGLGRQPPRVMLAAAAVFSVGIVLLGVFHWYWVTAALLFLTALSGTALMTSANTTLQLGAPDELRGRIISIFILLQAGSTPIGGFVTGVLSDALGVTEALAILGGLCGLGFVVAALQWRMTIRRSPSAVQAEPNVPIVTGASSGREPAAGLRR